MSPGGGGGSNDAVEQLLLKFGLDLGPVKQAATAIKAALEELNEMAEEVGKKSSSGIAATNEELAKLKLGAQAAAAMSKQQQQAAKSQTEEEKKQTQLKKTKLEQEKVETQEAHKKTAEKKAETAEIQKQIALLRKKRLEEGAQPKQPPGGGGAGGLLQKFLGGAAQTFAGGSIGGMLAAAMAGGGAFAIGQKAVEALTNSLGDLKTAIHDAFVETESLINVWNNFEAVTARVGISATEAMEKLKLATRGAVDDPEMLRYEMAALNNVTGLSADKMAEWAQIVTDAAVVAGRTRREGIEALTRSMITGQTRNLQFVTGIKLIKNELDRATPAFTEAAQRFRDIESITRQIKAGTMVKPVATLTESWTKLKIEIGNAFEGIFVGFSKTKGYENLVFLVDKLADAFARVAKSTEEFAKWVGDADWGPWMGMWERTRKELEAIDKFLQPLADKMAAVGLIDKKYSTEGQKAEAARRAKEEADRKKKEEEQRKKELAEGPMGEDRRRYEQQILSAQAAVNDAIAQQNSDRRKAELAAEKTSLDAQIKLQEEAYAKGFTNAKAHAERMAELQRKILANREATIRHEAQVQEDQLTRQISTTSRSGELSGEFFNVTNAKVEELRKRITVVREKMIADLKAAGIEISNTIADQFRKADEDILKLQTEQIQRSLHNAQAYTRQLMDDNEDALNEGARTYSKYFDRREQLQRKDEERQVQAVRDEIKLNEGRAEVIARLEQKITDIRRTAARERRQWENQRSQEELGWIDKIHGARVRAAERALDFERRSERGGERISQLQLLQQQISALKAQADETEKLYRKEVQDFVLREQFKAQWEELINKIKLMNEELLRMQDITEKIGNGFEILGQGISRIFTSPFARNLASSIGIGAESLTQARQRSIIMSRSMRGIEDVETGKSRKLSPSEKMDLFVQKLGAAVGAVGDFVTALTQAQSALSGGIGGAMAGGGLGQTIGGLFSGMSKMAGPIGQAIGAAVGGVMGMITGAKNAQVRRNLDEVRDEFTKIMDAFEENSNNLQLTIRNLENLILATKGMQAGSKKGSDEYQKAIDQYNQQLHDLQVQQMEVIRNMDQQLAILRAPEGMRDFLGQLKDIMEEYNKFAGAARNAEELARANEWLTLSLKEYTATVSQQFDEANMSAIENALKLNDLLYQRQQLIDSINDQIRSVLTQGILTRTPTRAQAAGEQIAKIKEQTDRQMSRLNMEIEATQYRVNNERQIFTMATTRIGLETQLLTLQKAQIDEDMARIRALGELVTQIQQGDIMNNPWVQGLMGTLQPVKNPLNNPRALSGNYREKMLEKLFGAAYESRSELGYADFRGQNL